MNGAQVAEARCGGEAGSCGELVSAVAAQAASGVAKGHAVRWAEARGHCVKVAGAAGGAAIHPIGMPYVVCHVACCLLHAACPVLSAAWSTRHTRRDQPSAQRSHCTALHCADQSSTAQRSAAASLRAHIPVTPVARAACVLAAAWSRARPTRSSQLQRRNPRLPACAALRCTALSCTPRSRLPQHT